jgi:hypothetical protein
VIQCIVACRAVSTQRLGKHVPTATDTRATIEVLLETLFSTRSVPKSYKEANWGYQASSVRESVKKRWSWNGAAGQRILEPGSSGIDIVRNRYQETSNEDTDVFKRLRMCSSDL